MLKSKQVNEYQQDEKPNRFSFAEGYDTFNKDLSFRENHYDTQEEISDRKMLKNGRIA